MASLVLVTGGVRSGKSRFALLKAKKLGASNFFFIATAQALDKEMVLRIKTHKKNRPKNCTVIEEPFDLKKAFTRAKDKKPPIIIDCITFLIANLLTNKNARRQIFSQLQVIVEESKKRDLIIVTNEVGLGIVPANKLARVFRDVHGEANQFLAKEADEVYLMVCSWPLKVK